MGMEQSPTIRSKILNLRLALNNYPILGEKIREQMRHELFIRGIIPPNVLEEEVERKAIESQKLEGLTDPLVQESEEIWQKLPAEGKSIMTAPFPAYDAAKSNLEIERKMDLMMAFRSMA